MRSQPALSSTCRRRSEAKPRRKPHQAADAYPTGTHGQQGRPGARPVAQPLTSSFLREGLVWKLWTETGDIETLGVSLENFLAAAAADPVDYSDQRSEW